MSTISRTCAAILGLVWVGCAAGEVDREGAVSAAQVATGPTRRPAPTRDRQSCALPAYTPRGPALSAFEDFAELDAYVVHTSASCVPVQAPPRAETLDAQRAEATREDARDVRSTYNMVRTGEVLLVSTSERLYAVDVRTPGAPRQLDAQPLTAGDAQEQGLRKLEVHVVGEIVYVIRKIDDLAGEGRFSGLRFAQQEAAPAQPYGAPFVPAWPGLGITAFRLRAGKLARLGEWLVESDERRFDLGALATVIDGRLTFHVSHELASEAVNDGARGLRYDRAKLPRIFTPPVRESVARARTLLEAGDVHRPLASVHETTLHALAQCAVEADGALRCSAKGWVGSRGQGIHLASGHGYVWTEGHVYAASFSPFAVAAHRVTGAPRTARGLAEIGDALHVAVPSRTSAGTTLSMWSLPRAAFDARGEQAAAPRTLAAVSAEHGAELDGEAFVGATYVASLYTFLPSRLATRVVYDVLARTPPHTDVAAVRHYAIEPLGDERALFVQGSTVEPFDDALSLEVWKLSAEPAPIATLTLPDTRPPWDRDGLFVQETLDGARTRFALPLLRRAQPSTELEDAWLGLFELRPTGLALLGRAAPPRLVPLAAEPCVGLCDESVFAADAFHLGDRTFALRGRVLVELGLAPLMERGRLQLDAGAMP
ncbi:MAG: hypothetical protein ABW252_14640 [Polyangiales bacterium]